MSQQAPNNPGRSVPAQPPRPWALQDHEANDLPSMNTFMKQHTLQITRAERDTNCVICQEVYDPQVTEQSESLVRVRRCGRGVHIDCLGDWMSSTHIQRNTCPTCRTPLCKLNVLTPEQTAELRAEEEEYYDRLAGFDNELYTWLMRQTDRVFERERSQAQNYLGILTELTELHWSQFPGRYISPDHTESGDIWLYHSIASRLCSRIREADIAESYAAAALIGLQHWMQDELYGVPRDNQQHPEPIDNRGDRHQTSSHATERSVDRAIADNGNDAACEARYQAARDMLINSGAHIVTEIANVEFARKAVNNTFRVGMLNGELLGIVYGADSVVIADGNRAIFYQKP